MISQFLKYCFLSRLLNHPSPGQKVLNGKRISVRCRLIDTHQEGVFRAGKRWVGREDQCGSACIRINKHRKTEFVRSRERWLYRGDI